MSKRAKLMNRWQTIDALKYIAKSPAKEHGGFDAQTILIAKSALKHLRNQTKP